MTQTERVEFLRSLTKLTVDDLVKYAETRGLNNQLRTARSSEHMNKDEKTITLDALKGAIFSATDENGYSQELGDAIWKRL